MRVLVTGGAGFIGSHFVDRLVERGHEVTILDNLDPQVHGSDAAEPRHVARHVASGAVRFLRGDVTDSASVARGLEGAEAVVHLAAAVGVGQSMYQPYHYVHTNDAGTGLLLERILERRDRIAKLVVASSMSHYGEGAYRCPKCGGTEGRPREEAQLAAGRWEVTCASCAGDLEPVPTPETKPPDIASIYAATKKHQEDLFVSFGRGYRIPTFALRFFNVFGARQSLGNPYTGVAAIFLSRLLSGHAPLVFEDGKQCRDFVDVRDVAEALLMATEFPRKGAHVLNVGTGRATSVAQVAEELARELGLARSPVFLGKYRVGDIRHCIADPTRAREVLGFEAKRSFRGALPDLIAWCREERATDRVETSLEELRRQGLVR